VPENKVAPSYQKRQATAQQAEAVVDALMKVFDQPLFDWERPRVIVETGEHGRTLVVWEEGPHGWIWVFPCGGMLKGTGWEVFEAELPRGVWVEPYDGCVLSVYQEVAERQSAEIRGERFASSVAPAWVPWFALLVMFERTPLANCWTCERPPNARAGRGTNSA
jgi:hypothetical protein